MHNINDNAVQGRLSENYLTWKFMAWNILDTKYSQITVSLSLSGSKKSDVYNYYYHT